MTRRRFVKIKITLFHFITKKVISYFTKYMRVTNYIISTTFVTIITTVCAYRQIAYRINIFERSMKLNKNPGISTTEENGVL